MRPAGKSLASLVIPLIVAAACVGPAAARDGQHPRDGEIRDPDTLAWWHTTEALSGDSMEGRDTGSAAYQRAADYVAARFKEAGLEPAGDAGSYFQTVTMHEIAAVPRGTRFKLSRPDWMGASLEFLQEITIAPTVNFPTRLEAALTFRGYCGKDAMADIAGKIVVCFGTQRTGLPGAAARTANAHEGHALGLINVDDPYFTIEPPRWPAAYARTVTLRTAGAPVAEHAEPFASMRLSSAAFSKLLFGTGQDAAAILKAGGAQQPLPNFEIPSRLRLQVQLAERDISSPNVLAVLPGVNPTLRNEYHVIKGGAAPVLGGVARAGRAIFKTVALVAFGIVPAKAAPLEDRVQRVDEDETARQVQPAGPAALAEAAQQIVFRQAGQALADQPVHQAQAGCEFHGRDYAVQT